MLSRAKSVLWLCFFFQITLGLISETHLCSFAFHRVLFVLISWAIWKCRVHVHKHRLGNAETSLRVELSLQSLFKNYILGLNQPKLWSNTSRPCPSVSVTVARLSLGNKWQITPWNETLKNRSWLPSTSAAYAGATTAPVAQSLPVDPATQQPTLCPYLEGPCQTPIALLSSGICQ